MMRILLITWLLIRVEISSNQILKFGDFIMRLLNVSVCNYVSNLIHTGPSL